MAELKVGDSLPSGVTFSYVPYTPENGEITSCGIPVTYDASKGMRRFLQLLSLSALCAQITPPTYPAISSLCTL